MNQGILIQARTGSTRLPNKLLLPFYENQGILEMLIQNLTVLKNRVPLILCTSTKKEDDVLEEIANKYGLECFRGSETNVLDRFIGAAEHFMLDSIVRICADNPFLMAEGVSALLSEFNYGNEIDYCSYQNEEKVPVIKTHLGLFGEVIAVSALLKVVSETSEKTYLEHVTNYIYENPKDYNVKLLPLPKEIYRNKDIRFTLDDWDDFQNLSELYKVYLDLNKDLEKTIIYALSNKKHASIMQKNIKKYSK